VLAAGSKVLGRLTQVNPSGYVGIQFSRVAADFFRASCWCFRISSTQCSTVAAIA
jgi:hypothetical protein